MAKNESVMHTEATDANEIAKRLAMSLRMLMEDGHAIDPHINIDRVNKVFVCKGVLNNLQLHELAKLNARLKETLKFYGVTEISDEVRDEIGKLVDTKTKKASKRLNIN